MARFTLSNVRLSFPSLFEKATYDGQETKYEATLLIPKENEELIKIIKKHTKTALIDKFGTADKIPKGIDKGARYCLRDGDDQAYDGYEGCMSFKASNNKRPRTMDRNKQPCEADSGLLYSGCYVDAIVELWVQRNNFGTRINSNLLAVRHRADGEAFGAGGIPANVEDDFEDLEDEAIEEMDEEIDI